MCDGKALAWLRPVSLRLICLNMAIVAGALSFSTRPISIDESVWVQEEVWSSFQQKGAGSSHPNWLVRSNSGRILVPAVVAGTTQLGLSWKRAFSLVRLISIVGAYLCFFHYLRWWMADPAALAGLLYVAATIPLTFSNWHELPTDFPELWMFTLAYALLRSNSWGLLVPLVALATLNRETAVFIPLLAFAYRFDRGQFWKASRSAGVLGLAWFIPYLALRWWTGVPIQGLYGSTWAHNMTGLARFFENLNPFNHYFYYIWLLGPLWLLPFLRPERLPRLLRRGLWLTPAFIAVYVFFGGYLNEPRPLMHLYCLFVPAGLIVLFPDSVRSNLPGT